MYYATRASILQRDIRLGRRKTFVQKQSKKPPTHQQRIAGELQRLGVSGLRRFGMESRYLPRVIHEAEHIMGVVYGRNSEGFAVLVATDRRVVYLDKKLLFVKQDEVTYDVVSGVSLSTNGIASTVTLHTRVKDFTLRTFNNTCARGFMSYIEARRLERLKGDPYDRQR